MKILIAPAHYIVSVEDGSEYTRAYEYISEISKDKNISGDIILGFSKFETIGNFKVHRLLKTKPGFIGIGLRLWFAAAVFLKSLQLLSAHKYDCIWHLGPFAIDATFSLLAILGKGRTRFIIGPIYTPLTFKKGNDFGYFEKSKDGNFSDLSIGNKLSVWVYDRFYKTFSFLSRLTLYRSDYIFTIDKVGEVIIRRFKINNVATVPLSIMSNGFKHFPRKISNKMITILSVGYLVDRKRMVDLIEAMNLLVHKYKTTNLKLTIVGDGPQKTSLQELANKYKLNSWVKLEGYVPRNEVAKYYQNADIFAFASVSDSMPGVCFEAMCSALPMVLASNDTSEQFKQDNFGGTVVPGYNPEKIAIAIRKLIKNKNLYQWQSLANYNLFARKYNLEAGISTVKKIISGEYA